MCKQALDFGPITDHVGRAHCVARTSRWEQMVFHLRVTNGLTPSLSSRKATEVAVLSGPVSHQSLRPAVSPSPSRSRSENQVVGPHPRVRRVQYPSGPSRSAFGVIDSHDRSAPAANYCWSVIGHEAPGALLAQNGQVSVATSAPAPPAPADPPAKAGFELPSQPSTL